MPQHYNLLRINCFFWLVAKIISIKVWLAERLYPVIPVFAFTENASPAIHSSLFYISCTCLALMVLLPKRRDILVFLLITEIFACLLDITRWQPWEYQYIFTLFIFLINKDNPRGLYSSMTLLLASVYIYSGLHKVNGGFLHVIWEKMILVRFFHLERADISNPVIHYLGLLLPLIEIVCGLGLLFSRKKAPALVLIGMHLFILVFLGPLGINYNIVVWPWNAAMILLLYSMFVGRDTSDFSFRETTRRWNPVVVLFWGILPLLSFVGYWDQYLSSALYSGSSLQMNICLEDTDVLPELNAYYISGSSTSCDGRLNLQKWAMTELDVQPYPELWYYKRFKKQWEKRYGTTTAWFTVYSYPYKEKQKID